MISKELASYSLNSLKRRKSRSLLTIFSILIGITTIFIFVSFGLGLYSYVNSFVSESSADKVLIQLEGVSVPGIDQAISFSEEDLSAIKQSAGVYEVEGVRMKVAEIEQNRVKKFVFLMGMDPENSLMSELSNFEIQEGRELTKQDRGKVTLGYNYKLENKIFPRGLEINDRIEVDGKDLTIVGFYEPLGNPQDDSNMYLNNEYFAELYPNRSEKYDMVVARIDIQNIDTVVENIEKSLRSSRSVEKGKEDFYVASFEDLLESYTSALNVIIGFIVLIAFISVIVSAINTANTMITSVIERTKEIGIMKSIGARNSEVLNVFLFESSLLGLVAGTLGVILGFLFTSIAGSILADLGWSFLKPHYSISLFLGCILFATVTGAFSGVFPAISASKTNPVNALRYE